MNIDKDMNKAYSKVIDLCKKLKPHATNIALFENYIYMDSAIDGVIAFCVPNVDYSRFVNLYYDMSQISDFHREFKVTKSCLEYEKDENGQYFLVINNEKDDEPHRVLLLNNNDTIHQMEIDRYQVILKLEGVSTIEELMKKLQYPSEKVQYIDEIIERMVNKQLCEIHLTDEDGVDYPILISKPFLGDLKKTKHVTIELIQKSTEENPYFIVRFRQAEEWGDVYTYAGFLKI